MQPRKLDVFFAFFVYGGNGGIASSNPFLRGWFAQLVLAATRDERIGKIQDHDFCDTPITMQRNASVLMARELGADVIVMIDSDNIPDHYLDRPGAKRFFESSFDFLYNHWDKGPVVVAAPYCGPPDEELVYIFEWINNQTGSANPDFRLQMIGRADASRRLGIQEAAALPTGVSMWDMRAFKLTEPETMDDPPWFDYEWKDKYRAAKSSTEDVFGSRNISMAGCVELGYNPLFCNWDAWAGHLKAKIVPPPEVPTADEINKTYLAAVARKQRRAERVIQVGVEDWNPEEHPPQPRWMEIPGECQGRPFTRLGFCAPPAEYSALEQLVKSRVTTKNPSIVEVGSWVGESAIAIYAGCSHWRPKILCVDTFTGNPKDDSSKILEYFGADKVRMTFKQNTAGLPIELAEDSSLNVAAQYDKRVFDFVYIDAQHTYDEVKADILAWLPLLKATGTLAGHDYCEHYPEVIKVVDEIFGPLVNVIANKSIWWVDVAAYRRREAAKNGRGACQPTA